MAAIELKSTVSLQDSGGGFTTIGISDALTLHTMSEILDFIYCSASTDFWQNPKAEMTGIYSEVSRSPYVFSISGTSVLMEAGDEGYSADSLYGKTVWLYGNSLGTFVNPATNNACIVTNMDVKKFVMYVANPANTSASFRTYWGNDWQIRQASSWNDVGKAFDLVCDIYFQDNGGENFKDISIADTHRHGTDGKIKPYIILPALNGTYYFASICDEYHHGSSSGYLFNTSGQLFDALRDSSSNKFSFSPNGVPIPDSVSYWSHGMDYYGVYANNLPYSIDFHSGQTWNAYSPLTLKCVPNTLDSMNRVKMMCGIWFYTDKVYKPIIVDGYVTGYGDPTDDSDFDNYSYNKGNQHDVPPAPPSPTPSGSDEDNDDPIPVTGAPYSSGLARYYVTTVGSVILSHISQAIGSWNLKDSGKDLYKNIISCKLIKSPAPIPVSGSEPFTVYGVTLQYEGSDITLPLINDNPTASFGSYNIPRKFNDFRDYAPYTKVEIYLPYCGWTVLPSHVVGRSVSVTYYTDIIAATCKAVVYCGSNIVAEAAGVIGLDIPMVTENAGAKAEAVTMGLLAYGKAGLQTALGVGAAVATKGKAGVKQAVSGLSDVVSAYSQTAMAFNQNYTEINGKNGDGCCIAGISAIVIKITRPKYGSNTTPPYVPSEYAHSTGYVSMKSAKVRSFTGLLVAANVDTSGISGATEREKQLIKLYLESGIYVNHPS